MLDLTLEEKKELLHIAQTTVAAAAEGRELDGAGRESELPGLRMTAGAFVTLYSHGELRGCIGTFDTSKPVSQTVREMAVAAATRDTRFHPVMVDELDDIDVSLSILAPPVPVADLDDIRIGRDGLIMHHGHRRGVLLPKVASERAWTVSEFLSATCVKAGLPRDAWQAFDQADGVTVMRFETVDIAGSDVGATS